LDSEGQPLPGITPIGVFFTFAEAPVPLIPLALALDPASSTVSAVGSTGVALTAAGFSPNEELTLVVTGPDGVVPPAEDAALNIYANDEDGSYATVLLLPSAAVGDYSVALTGVRSERTITTVFAVTADPVPSPTPTPGPTTPPGPAPAGGPGGSLANTGSEAGFGFAAGGLLLLAGAGVVLMRRRTAKAQG
ncbi:MAG: LPXTG cell wall anchor domain-containing protein, partial [Herbiconiux sp.]|nr:LPXTG cell wall anchor domain-containing protein [Herbiconiux sp.]